MEGGRREVIGEPSCNECDVVLNWIRNVKNYLFVFCFLGRMEAKTNQNESRQIYSNDET